MINIELINEINELYFQNSFSFHFVSNNTLKDSILSGNDLIDREIQSYVNLKLIPNFTSHYTAFELADWDVPEGKNRMADFSFIDFKPEIKEGKQRKFEVIGKINVNRNRRIKDITDDCLKMADDFLSKRLKENQKKVLSGDLT